MTATLTFVDEMAPFGAIEALVGSSSLTGTLPTNAPDLSLFDNSVGGYISVTDFLGFTIDSVTVVPEPSTGSLVALGLVGLAARGRRGRVHSCEQAA
jgi:hypothetical protein